jgi:hypothetical protein
MLSDTYSRVKIKKPDPSGSVLHVDDINLERPSPPSQNQHSELSVACICRAGVRSLTFELWSLLLLTCNRWIQSSRLYAPCCYLETIIYRPSVHHGPRTIPLRARTGCFLAGGCASYMYSWEEEWHNWRSTGQAYGHLLDCLGWVGWEATASRGADGAIRS